MDALNVLILNVVVVGLNDLDAGIALRFPRLVRAREDKRVEDATTASQVAQLYQNQGSAKGEHRKKREGER